MTRRGWLLFTALGFAWGTPYLFTKIAIGELPPTSIMFARTLLGALILAPFAIRRGRLRPLLAAWRPMLAFTVIEICVPWLLITYAQRDLSSSLAALLIAAVPLMSAALVWLTGQDRLGPMRIAGLAAGFTGVAALVGFDLRASGATPIILFAIIVFCHALGPMILIRRLSKLPSLGVTAGALAVAAVVNAPLGLAQWPTGTVSTQAWVSIGGLGIVCTGAAFFLLVALVVEVGPARATVVTYVNPVIAVLLGAVVLNERVSLTTVVGSVLILGGCVLAAGPAEHSRRGGRKDASPGTTTARPRRPAAGPERERRRVT